MIRRSVNLSDITCSGFGMSASGALANAWFIAAAHAGGQRRSSRETSGQALPCVAPRQLDDRVGEFPRVDPARARLGKRYGWLPVKRGGARSRWRLNGTLRPRTTACPPSHARRRGVVWSRLRPSVDSQRRARSAGGRAGRAGRTLRSGTPGASATSWSVCEGARADGERAAVRPKPHGFFKGFCRETQTRRKSARTASAERR